MAEKIIIEVGLSSDEYNKKAKELGASIKAIKEEQTALKKAGDTTSVAYQSNAQQLRALSQEQKAYINLAQQADGSINALRAELSLLTAQYNALSKEERENTEQGRLLSEAAKNVSDKLKEQEGRIGDTRRNVGNYKEALRDVESTLSDLKDQLTDQIIAYNSLSDAEKKNTDQGKKLASSIESTKDEIKKTSTELAVYQKAQKQAGDAANEFANYEEVSSKKTEAFHGVIRSGTASLVPYGDTILSSAENAKALSGGLIQGAKASEIFKIALASTGIGFIVAAVIALINYLRQFDPVMDAIQQATAGLRAGFEAFGRIIFELVKPLGQIFSNPLQSAKDLGNFLLNNLINRFKAFGVILDGILNLDFKKVSNGVIQVTTGIEGGIDKAKRFGDGVGRAADEIARAAKNAAQLTKEFQDLEDAQQIQEVQNAKALQQINQLILQSRNRSLSEKQRQDLLKQAGKIDEDNFRAQADIANQEFQLNARRIADKAKLTDAEKKQLADGNIAFAIALKDRTNVTDEDIENYKKALLGKTAALDESTKRQEKIQNQSDALEEKRQAAAEKARDAALDADRARLESAERTRALMFNGRVREEAELVSGFSKQIEQNRKYGATTQQIEKEKHAALQQLRKKFNDEDLKNANDYENLLAEGKLKTVGENFQREFELRNELIVRNRDFELQNTDLTESEKLIITENYRQQKEDLDATFDEQHFERESELAQRSFDFQTSMIDAEAELQDRKANIYSRAFGIISGLFGKNTAVAKAAFIAEKAAAIASVVIQTQKALALNRVAEQAQAASASLLLPFPLNIAAVAGIKVAGIAQRTQILIEGILSGVAVASTAISGFKDGVIDFKSDGKGNNVKGSGTSRSDSINARLSNGESVINAKSTQLFKPILSAINQAGGGRSLMGYSPSISMATGGMFKDSSAATVVQATIDPKMLAEAITEGFSNAPAPRVAVDDINSVNDRKRVEVENATF